MPRNARNAIGCLPLRSLNVAASTDPWQELLFRDVAGRDPRRRPLVVPCGSDAAETLALHAHLTWTSPAGTLHRYWERCDAL